VARREPLFLVWDLQNWSLVHLARRIHGHFREFSGLGMVMGAQA